MADQSPVLALPLIQPAQAQKHITHNEALLVLDALVQLSVATHDTTAPPVDPATGDRHIVGTGATGAWAGKDGAVALWTGTVWHFLDPQAGWRADHSTSGTVLRHDGTLWQEVSGPGDPDTLGIGGATADAVNRLAVQSGAVLLSHDATGDHRLKVNRADATDTASLVFQTGFVGGAEMGLAGNGNWSVKVSPDGAAWTEALVVDATSGQVQGAAIQTGPEDTTAGRLATVGNTYGPASLIGTVAETGGIPSGAVMESGADGAGGHYLRLANGSQVCWGRLNAPAHDISTSSGGAFQGAPLTASFAAAFAAPPALTVNERLAGGTADIWSVLSSVSATGFALLPLALSARVQDRAVDYIAYGQAPGIGAANTGIAPVITGAPIVSGTEAVGAALTAAAASVSGTPTPTRTWQWRRGGVAISGATGASYTLVSADVGETLTVVQTETNAGGSTSAESAATGVIAAGGFSPADLFATTEDGAWYHIHPDHCWTDVGMTTGATVGDAVAAVTDRSGNGHHAIQSTVSKRPVLRQAASGNYYLEFDNIDADGFVLGTFARPADMWEVYGMDTNGDTVGVLWNIAGNYAGAFDNSTNSPTAQGAGTFAALYVDGVSQTPGGRQDTHTAINGTHVSVFNYTGGSASAQQSLGNYGSGFQLGIHLYGMVWRDRMTTAERGDLETWMAGVTG